MPSHDQKPLRQSSRRGPGHLEGDNSIILHTRQGMALFDGRQGDPDKGIAPIIGVPRFYGSIKQAYFDAAADDPWADWWLVRVDEAIDKARRKLAALKEEVASYHPANQSIAIGNPHSVEPEPRPLNFAVPSYPYRMAYIVAECDLLILEVLNLFHVGLMTRKQKERLVNLIGKVARGALSSATGYRHQGVTRNDVAANNPKARKALELMGQVPEDILTLQRRSDYAPELRQYADTGASEGGADLDAVAEG